ncbi:MAG: OmpA family protein [Chitinophagales bacterium]|nr:OmpA family protein [Chitinophagales bacterium]
MIYTNYPRFVLLSVFLLSGLTLTAQKVKEAVILYNAQPVRALIDENGNVVKILAAEPNYLSDKELDIPEYDKDFRQVVPEKIKESAQGSNQDKVQTNSSDQTEIVGMPAISKEDEIVAPIVDNSRMTLQFDNGMAVLTTKVRKELDRIVDYLKQHPNINVVAMTLSKYEDELLSTNRQSSVRTYLKIKGIPENRIIFKSFFSDINIQDVKIEFSE